MDQRLQRASLESIAGAPRDTPKARIAAELVDPGVRQGETRGSRSRTSKMAWGTDRQIDQCRLGYSERPFTIGKVRDEFQLHAVQSTLEGDQPLAFRFENVSSHHPRQFPNRLPTGRPGPSATPW
jgi:hypothetical protein